MRTLHGYIRREAATTGGLKHQPSQAQLQALRLALPSGKLRRLPGGYWVGDEHPEIARGTSPQSAAYAGTSTVEAAANRGWFEREGEFRVVLTPQGLLLAQPNTLAGV